jgi:hypothetical protein
MEGSMTIIKRRTFLKSGLWAAAGAAALNFDTVSAELGGAGVANESVMLDTEALIWVDQDDERLGSESRTLIKTAFESGSLYVSSVSFWEIVSLVRLGRLEFESDVGAWRQNLLTAGLRELGVDGIIGVPEDDALDGNFFKTVSVCLPLRPVLNTPRDTMISTPPHLLGSLIVASAVRLGGTFITSDRTVLDTTLNEFTLKRHDAHV